LNRKENTVEVDGTLVSVTEIDWEKRNWRKIYTPEEEEDKERASKAWISSQKYFLL
jgi:hypothetical protein